MSENRHYVARELFKFVQSIRHQNIADLLGFPAATAFRDSNEKERVQAIYCCLLKLAPEQTKSVVTWPLTSSKYQAFYIQAAVILGPIVRANQIQCGELVTVLGGGDEARFLQLISDLLKVALPAQQASTPAEPNYSFNSCNGIISLYFGTVNNYNGGPPPAPAAVPVAPPRPAAAVSVAPPQPAAAAPVSPPVPAALPEVRRRGRKPGVKNATSLSGSSAK